ncbi:hypothetical protein CJF31_00007607 [Rutstroemia sp. NJR-2017a BVV2]|nr:hypothetical protein CJF31_00007607 [Rutstroemia sp. NJR-2017a BVV2]
MRTFIMHRNTMLAALILLVPYGSLAKPVAGGSWYGDECVCPPVKCPSVVTSYTTIPTNPIETVTVTKTVSISSDSHNTPPVDPTSSAPTSSPSPEVMTSPVVVPIISASTTPCEVITQVTTISGSVITILSTVTPPPQYSTVTSDVTIPGEPLTITTTAPGSIETTVIPGSTVVSTSYESIVVSTIPCSTITISELGSMAVSTHSASVVTITQTSIVLTTIRTAITITKTHPGKTLTITKPGEFITSTIEKILVPSTLPPSPTCKYDACLKQMLKSSAVTSFCATYTAKVHSSPVELPGCVSECDTAPDSLSSACSCLVGDVTVLPVTASTRAPPPDSTPVDPGVTTTVPTVSGSSLPPLPPASETTLVTYSLIPSAPLTDAICPTPSVIFSTITTTTTFIQIMTTTGSYSSYVSIYSPSSAFNSTSMTTPCSESEIASTTYLSITTANSTQSGSESAPLKPTAK